MTLLCLLSIPMRRKEWKCVNYYYHAPMNDMTYFMSERLKLSSNPYSTMSLYVSLMLYKKVINQWPIPRA